MRVCTIASGSSGNCTYVGSRDTHILIDAGISGKRIEAGLNAAHLTAKDLSGILITHEHIDHIRGLGVMARRHEIPIYISENTYKAVMRDCRIKEIPDHLICLISANSDFMIGDLNISPFSVSHDAADPLGFRLSNNGKSFAAATDLGQYDENTVRILKDLDVLLLEANHDIKMLEAGPYPYHLKRRILSEKGHLSNESAGQLLNDVLHDKMKHIILGHLSRENNYPELEYQTVRSEISLGDCPYRAEDVSLMIAKRDMPGSVLEW